MVTCGGSDGRTAGDDRCQVEKVHSSHAVHLFSVPTLDLQPILFVSAGLVTAPTDKGSPCRVRSCVGLWLGLGR